MSQFEKNIQETIQESLSYHAKGDLQVAIGKLALAIQLISHQQIDELTQDRKQRSKQPA